MSEKLLTPQGRLQWISEQLGMNHKEFATRLGLSTSGYHTRLQRGTALSQTLALAAEAAFGFRSQWLLNGIGPKEVENKGNLMRYR